MKVRCLKMFLFRMTWSLVAVGSVVPAEGSQPGTATPPSPAEPQPAGTTTPPSPAEPQPAGTTTPPTPAEPSVQPSLPEPNRDPSPAPSGPSSTNATPSTQDETHFLEVLRPRRYSISLGVGLVAQPIYAQEVFFQESWLTSAGVHWDLGLCNACEILLRMQYQRPLSLPESMTQIRVSRTEYRVGAEVGFESFAFVPLGASFGITNVRRASDVQLPDNVINESGSTTWSENIRRPSLRTWVGVPLLPSHLDLLLSVGRVLSADASVARNIYASELRYEF